MGFELQNLATHLMMRSFFTVQLPELILFQNKQCSVLLNHILVHSNKNEYIIILLTPKIYLKFCYSWELLESRWQNINLLILQYLIHVKIYGSFNNTTPMIKIYLLEVKIKSEHFSYFSTVSTLDHCLISLNL